LKRDCRSVVFVCCLFGCGDGNGDDSSENAIDQSTECADYLECVGVVDPRSVDSLSESYGPAGSCWDDEESTDSCTKSCIAAMNALYLQHPTVDECSNGHGSDLIFGADAAWRYEPTSCYEKLKPYTVVAHFHGTTSWSFTVDFDDYPYMSGTFHCTIAPASRTFSCDTNSSDPSGYTSEFGGFFADDMQSGGAIFAVTGTEYWTSLGWVCNLDATPVH